MPAPTGPGIQRHVTRYPRSTLEIDFGITALLRWTVREVLQGCWFCDSPHHLRQCCSLGARCVTYVHTVDILSCINHAWVILRTH